MLRSILSIFIIAMSALASTVQGQTSLVIGNCVGSGATYYEYLGDNAGAGCALSYSRYKMRAYKGSRLTALNVRFDGKAEGRILIGKSIADTPVYTQAFEAKRGWNEIILETPYEIDGGELTFGFVSDVLTGGTVVYSDALVEGKEYVNRGTGWEAFTKGSLCMTARLEGETLPSGEVALGQVRMPMFVRTGAEASIMAEVASLGTESVSELTVIVHQGNDATTFPIRDLNIAPRNKKSVSLPLSLTADGDYNVWIEVSEVNAIADPAPIDNTSTPQEVYVRSAFEPRNVLLEVFSTERCTNCPTGHETIKNTLGTMPRIIEMTHHAGFYTDKFTIPESVEYEWFYKSPEYSTSFAPAFMTDRTAWTNYPTYYPYGTPVAMSLTSKSLRTAYNEASSVPALATIAIMPHYDAADRTLSVDVAAEALVVAPGCEHPALSVFLTEDGVMSKTQEGSLGSYEHRHLVRKSLTPTWGEAFAAAGSIARTYSCTLPEDWNADKMSIVAFVANYNAASNADCRVMNAAEVAVAEESDVVDDIVSPASPDTHLIIYNAQGQRLEMPTLPGFYITHDGRKCVVR